jgi:hypothetical protein
MARRGLLVLLVGLLASSVTLPDASGGDGASLGDHAEKALEKLPWEANVIRANLGKRHPVAVAGMYVMERQLLVLTNAGRVYC